MKKVISELKKFDLDKVKLYGFYWFEYRYGEDYTKLKVMNKEEIIECLREEFLENEFTENEILRTFEDLKSKEFIKFKINNYK